MHLESSKKKWYTPEAYAAGPTSDLIPPNGIELTGQQAMDVWIEGSFHRFPILNPALKQVGFGAYTEDSKRAIAMQIRRPTALDNPLVTPSHRFVYPRPRRGPVRGSGIDSADRISVPELKLSLGSVPQRRVAKSACGMSRLSTPTGFPITLQLGGPAKPKVQSATLASDGRIVESCAFDASSYRGDDQTMTYAGQGSLENYGAIVIVPRQRLHSGASYQVSLVVDGKPYQWSFRIESSSAAE